MYLLSALGLDRQILLSKRGNKIKLLILVGILSISVMLFFVTPTYSKAPLEVASDRLIDLTNQERIKFGLQPLKASSVLNQAATNKAEDILNKQYFSHNSPDGKKFSQWVKDEGYSNYQIIGENLAMGFSSEEAVIKAWMNSQGHKDNILNPKYKDIGLAVIKGRLEGKNTYVIVQYFGATSNIIISENLIPYQNESFDLKNTFI
ncbi:MAG: hypothetical protein COU22_01840, partial [Candidatus Komeilibacteria bacterium CG10_big_fil_rev_8_21_14_0_10_41_13]